jgi:uncharacterized protein (DUF362 family)
MDAYTPGPVTISRCEDYDLAAVEKALAAALEPLGGMAAFVRPGDRVCLKPNLLMKAVPDKAITTHPAVVRAVVRAVKAAGASEVLVGDSPGGRHTPNSMVGAYETVGWAEVCREEGARLVLFEQDVVRVTNEHSSLYASFNIAKAVVDADVLISLPKFKTHGFQQFTGAVKNLFGCIPGLQKAQFHVKVPDRYDFGRMLVDLMLACKPKLAIMDAVVGMEGEGPGGGEPIHIGAIIASPDLVALDVVASAMAGFDPLEVYTNRAAAERGLGPKSIDEVEVRGTAWRDVAPAAFKRPARDISRHMPPAVARALRNTVAAKPVVGKAVACTGCATCRKSCPVEAITMREKRPHFVYDRCIR